MTTDHGGNPNWSPPGTRLVCSFTDIHSVRLDGTGKANLTGGQKRVAEHDDAASWGP